MTDVLTNPVSFVKEVQIPSRDDLAGLLDRLKNAPDASETGLRLLSSEESAQVNGGSLTSFTQNLSGQNKSDVKNSTLFAQLAADYAFSRYTAPMDWYMKYTEVLGTIGWNQPAFVFDTYKTDGTTVRLDKAVLGILAAIATGDELAVVAATMEGLESLGDDSKQMLIWDSNSNSGSNGNFQIFPVDTTPNGDVVMILDGMQFNASSSQYRFLWWTWETNSITIRRAANKFVLNEDVYQKVRAQVIDRLGEYAEELVAEIPLKKK